MLTTSIGDNGLYIRSYIPYTIVRSTIDSTAELLNLCCVVLSVGNPLQKGRGKDVTKPKDSDKHGRSQADDPDASASSKLLDLEVVFCLYCLKCTNLVS